MVLLEGINSNITTLIFIFGLIISFILMTYPFDQAVLLLGEIRCGSLLGLKGIKQSAIISGNVACQVFVSANITFYFLITGIL